MQISELVMYSNVYLSHLNKLNISEIANIELVMYSNVYLSHFNKLNISEIANIELVMYSNVYLSHFSKLNISEIENIELVMYSNVYLSHFNKLNISQTYFVFKFLLALRTNLNISDELVIQSLVAYIHLCCMSIRIYGVPVLKTINQL